MTIGISAWVPEVYQEQCAAIVTPTVGRRQSSRISRCGSFVCLQACRRRVAELEENKNNQNDHIAELVTDKVRLERQLKTATQAAVCTTHSPHSPPVGKQLEHSHSQGSDIHKMKQSLNLEYRPFRR